MGRIQFTYFSKTMVEAFLQKKKTLLDWQHNDEQIKICVQRSAPPYHHRRQTIQNGSEDHRHSMQAFGLVPFKHFTHWCSGQCCHGACGFSFSCSVLLLQSKDMYVRSVLRKCTDVAFAVHSTAKSLQLYMKKCYSETINLLMQSFQVVSNGLFIPSYVTELLPINLIRCEVFHREPGQRLRSTG